MRGAAPALLPYGRAIMRTVLEHARVARLTCPVRSASSARVVEEHELDSPVITEIMKLKRANWNKSWLWCDPVYDMISQHDGGAAGTLLMEKPEEQRSDAKQGGEGEHEVVTSSLPKDSSHVLRQWGCSDDDIAALFKRQPSLRSARLDRVNTMLGTLSTLGITGPDLVKIINCRPRFLWCRLNNHFDERVSYFLSLFGSKEMLRKAIIRNPSFLTHDFHSRIKPAISLYEQLGLTREELVPMLLSRPTMISRTSFEPEKVEYVRRTGVPITSKLYKYVVALIGVSRLDTIREKVANLVKFGLSEDEVLRLVGRSPLLLTLSIDKVQRNMTFILATMRMPASAVLEHPHLLYSNLESTLKPRMALACKIREIGLQPQIDGSVFRATRMTEKRFLKAYVRCHPDDIADVLMETYMQAKSVKRLAESSKKLLHKGFPF